MTDYKEMVISLFEEGMNERKFEILDVLVSPEYKNHNLHTPGTGAEGLKQILMMFTSAFPDMKIKLEDIFVAEGNKVVTRGSWTGTHQGAFMGIPATNKKVNVSYIDIWRGENSFLVDNWVQ